MRVYLLFLRFGSLVITLRLRGELSQWGMRTPRTVHVTILKKSVTGIHMWHACISKDATFVHDNTVNINVTGRENNNHYIADCACYFPKVLLLYSAGFVWGGGGECQGVLLPPLGTDLPPPLRNWFSPRYICGCPPTNLALDFAPSWAKSWNKHCSESQTLTRIVMCLRICITKNIQAQMVQL